MDINNSIINPGIGIMLLFVSGVGMMLLDCDWCGDNWPHKYRLLSLHT